MKVIALVLLWTISFLIPTFSYAGSPDASVDETSHDTIEAVIKWVRGADARYSPSGGVPYSQNDEGRLGWTESYAIRAYLTLFRLTHDQTWLMKAVRHLDDLQNLTDRAQGRTDYTGRSRLGWSATFYGNGDRIMALVESGNLAYAYLEFWNIVRETPVLSRQWRGKADQYARFAEQLLLEFEETYREDPVSGGGYYIFPNDEPDKATYGRGRVTAVFPTAKDIPLPFNQMLGPGRAMLLLAKWHPTSQWRARALALAQYWRHHVKVNNDLGWIWPYWSGQALAVFPSTEFTKYAGIDLDFLGLLLDTGYDLSQEERQAVQRTADHVLTSSTMALRLERSESLTLTDEGVGPDPFSQRHGDQRIGIVEWARWWSQDCDRHRAATHALQTLSASPSTWLGLTLLALYPCHSSS